MKAVSFVYWLMGLFELADPKQLNAKQTSLIKKHLHLVFEHEIDPSFGEAREALQEIHDEASSEPLTSFQGNTTTLQDLFGAAPISWDDAVEKLRDYMKLQETSKKLLTGPPRRPGIPRGGSSFDRGGGGRIMC